MTDTRRWCWGQLECAGRRRGARSLLVLLVTTGIVYDSGMSFSKEGLGADDKLIVRALLEPKQESTLSSEISARVILIPIRDGESFTKDSILVKFDCSGYDAQLAGAKANLRASEAKLANDRSLLALNSVGKLEIALTEADVEKSRAAVVAAAVLVNRCQIRAPFEGRVVERKVNEFETVGPGTPIVSIINDKDFDIKLIVPSIYALKIRQGMKFSVRFDEDGDIHEASVVRIGARIDPVSQTVKVIGTLTTKKSGLLGGMTGSARFDVISLEADQNRLK